VDVVSIGVAHQDRNKFTELEGEWVDSLPEDYEYITEEGPSSPSGTVFRISPEFRKFLISRDFRFNDMP
jgi:hypothetical protein